MCVCVCVRTHVCMLHAYTHGLNFVNFMTRVSVSACLPVCFTTVSHAVHSNLKGRRYTDFKLFLLKSTLFYGHTSNKKKEDYRK